MKETFKAIGNDVVNAGQMGLLIFLGFVSAGLAVKAGIAVLKKVDNLFDKKEDNEKKDE